jgi:hypothetical protein
MAWPSHSSDGQMSHFPLPAPIYNVWLLSGVLQSSFSTIGNGAHHHHPDHRNAPLIFA